MKTITKIALSATVALWIIGCSGGGDDKAVKLNESDLTKTFADYPEIERLRYFKEIKSGKAIKDFNVTGAGVRVTIMGEIVDASHPDLKNRIVKQYNTFSQKGKVLEGQGNQPYKFEQYGLDSGHGTHIAGTIAAECDNTGVQGIACGSQIDVYDIATYGNDNLPMNGWGDAHPFTVILEAFAAALDDVTKKASSKIITGSFNVESPYLKYKSGSSLQNQSLSSIFSTIDAPKKLLNTPEVAFANESDKTYLTKILENNAEGSEIALGTLLPLSKEWKKLEESIKRFQDKDGVYIITESNNIFENRTSVLNAMPSISDKVDPALWISAVLVKPKGIDDIKTIEDVDKVIAKGEYFTPINSCGEDAKEYCILIPAYDVLSTVTRTVAEKEMPFYTLDGRGHQLMTGHSMGAPMIAAALALMQEYSMKIGKNYSMKDLVRILKENANRTFPTYDEKVHGRGILDVKAALDAM
jgi:hypothetical protein